MNSFSPPTVNIGAIIYVFGFCSSAVSEAGEGKVTSVPWAAARSILENVAITGAAYIDFRPHIFNKFTPGRFLASNFFFPFHLHAHNKSTIRKGRINISP